MHSKKNYINIADIQEVLYGDDTYIKEFAAAAIQSFGEFSTHYRKFLLARDEANLRKAGHKIKPVTLMLHIGEIIEEYERAKILIQQQKEQKDLEQSVQTMTGIIDRILEELKELT